MTPNEMPACTACGATYPSLLAAALCCDVEFDSPTLVRAYD